MRYVYQWLVIFMSVYTMHTYCISLSKEDLQKIGNQILYNETGGRADALVYWAPDTPGPRFGLGHFLWHPTQPSDFPILAGRFQDKGYIFIDWLNDALYTGAFPWNSRDEFLADTTKKGHLQGLIARTLTEQVQFMVDRLSQQWCHIIHEAPEKCAKKVAAIYSFMTNSALGLYTLIDYSNFQGSGLASEGQNAYGLLQVLCAMPGNVAPENVQKLFVLTAARFLIARIEGSELQDFGFFQRWMTRLNTYANVNLISSKIIN